VGANGYDIMNSDFIWTLEYNFSWMYMSCKINVHASFVLFASLYTLSTSCSSQTFTILSGTLMDIYSNYPQFMPFNFLCVVD
jgi:hypothetical protein